MGKFWLAATVLLLCTGPGLAQDGASCDDARTQMAMNACEGAAWKAADGKLNALYRQVTARLAGDKDRLGLLVRAQRGWVAFRDAECAFRASAVEGGSMQPMVEAICLAGLTQSRNADLEAYLSCGEGDTSCPLPPG